jgi:D-ribose pyranase
VLTAIRANFIVGQVYMAEEFLVANQRPVQEEFAAALSGARVNFEPHVDFKKRVPRAIGLIRTGDTIQYANIIIESA